MADNEQSNTGTAYSTGQVSLPDDGQVLSSQTPDVGQPTSTSATPPPAQSASIPASAAPQVPPAGQGQPQPNQANQPQLTQPNRTAKVPENQPQNASEQDLNNHPAVQKAKLWNSIAETLSGGPRYTYKVDPNTGEMTKTKTPVSGKMLALSLIGEVLGGASAGAAEKGAGSQGRAAEKGFQAGQGMAAQRQQQGKMEASEAYQRQAAITSANFEKHRNQIMLSNMDRDAQQKDVDADKPLYDQLQAVGGIKEVINDNPEELSKHNVTRDMVLSVGLTPRINADGSRAIDSYGTPLWNQRLAVVDPNMMTTIPPETMKILQDHHIQGYTNADGTPKDLPKDTKLRASLVMGAVQKAQFIDLAESQLNSFNKGTPVNSAAHPSEPGVPQSTGGSVWTLYSTTGELADQMAKFESGGKKDARSVRNNNPGNLKATNTNQKQDMNGVPAGQRGYRIFDTPEEGRAAQINQLEIDRKRMPDASPEDFLKNSYIKGDSDDAVKSYASFLRKGAGSKGETHAPVAVAPQINLSDAIAKNPSIGNLLPIFAKYGTTGIANGTMQRDEEAGKIPPGTTGTFVNLMGGQGAIDEHNAAVAAHKDQLEETAKDSAKLDYNQAKLNQEQSAVITRNEPLISAIANGENIDMSKIASMRGSDREVVLNEIKRRNPSFNPASVDRATKLADEAADDTKSGSFGNSVANVNTAYGHMGEASESLGNLRKSEGRNFSDYTNKTISWMDDHFGNNPDYQRWKVSLNAAATDWQNLLNNSHALTDHDKQVASTVANPNATFGNAQASLSEMARTAAIRTIPLDERWKQTMHVHYPNLIQPQTIESIKKINDPVLNNYLKDLETGGSLVNGDTGIGEKGQRVGDLLNSTQQAPKQGDTKSYQGATYTFDGKQYVKQGK